MFRCLATIVVVIYLAMRIIFCEKLPSYPQDIHYCHYEFENLGKSNTTYHDLKILAEKNENSFFKQIEKWHSEVTDLGGKISRFWWLLPSSRLMSWAPPIYNPLYFIYLVQLLMNEKKISEIYVINAPAEAIDLANDFFEEVIVQHQAKQLMPNSTFFENRIKPYLTYFKHYITGKCNQPKLAHRPYLIHTNLLNSSNFLKGIDHYFGKILTDLPRDQREKISILIFYPDNKRKIKKEITRSYQALGFQVVFTYDALNIIDVFKIFIQSLVLNLKIKKFSSSLRPLILGNQSSAHFASQYADKILNHQHNALIELELLRACQKSFPVIAPEKLLYAYEERSIERALLLANQEQTRPALTYGFVHAVMHEGHLCYGEKSYAGAIPPRPDFIYVTGISAQRWFLNKGIKEDRIRIFGSPRCEPKFVQIEKDLDIINILFLGGQDHELIEFGRMLEKMPEVLSRCNLTLRFKPYVGVDEQQKGLERIRKSVPHVKVEGGDLFEQLKQYDLVFFSTSSSGLEAILNGKPAFHIKLDQYFNLDPLACLDEGGPIVRIKNISDLDTEIKKLKNFKKEQWNELLTNQMEEAQQIYEKCNSNKIFTS